LIFRYSIEKSIIKKRRRRRVRESPPISKSDLRKIDSMGSSTKEAWATWESASSRDQSTESLIMWIEPSEKVKRIRKPYPDPFFVKTPTKT